MDYYAILGVSEDASIADINTAYKKLALKHHPDKSGGDNESMEQFRKVCTSPTSASYFPCTPCITLWLRCR